MFNYFQVKRNLIFFFTTKSVKHTPHSTSLIYLIRFFICPMGRSYHDCCSYVTVSIWFFSQQSTAKFWNDKEIITFYNKITDLNHEPEPRIPNSNVDLEANWSVFFFFFLIFIKYYLICEHKIAYYLDCIISVLRNLLKILQNTSGLVVMYGIRMLQI